MSATATINQWLPELVYGIAVAHVAHLEIALGKNPALSPDPPAKPALIGADVCGWPACARGGHNLFALRLAQAGQKHVHGLNSNVLRISPLGEGGQAVRGALVGVSVRRDQSAGPLPRDLDLW
jgi:hypothetical protein